MFLLSVILGTLKYKVRLNNLHQKESFHNILVGYGNAP